MKKLKRILRLLTLIFFIIIASSGVMVPPVMMRREKYQDDEIKTEYVEQNESEEQQDFIQFNELD